MIFRICALILVFIVSCDIKILSYLWLFLVIHVSYNIICIIVSINFVICLFWVCTLSVSKYCCGL